MRFWLASKLRGAIWVFELLFVVALVVGAIWAAAPVFGAWIGANKSWVQHATTEAKEGQLPKLLNSAVHHGIITYDMKAGRFEITPKGEIPPETPEEKERRPADILSVENTKTLLWHPRGPGVNIRREFNILQQQNYIMALRFGAPGGGACTDHTAPVGAQDIPCLQPEVIRGARLISKAHDPRSLGESQVHAMLSGASAIPPSPWIFGPLALGQTAQFSPWWTANLRDMPATEFDLDLESLRDRMPVGTRRLHLNVVGHLTGLEGAPRVHRRYCFAPTGRAGRMVVKRCDAQEGDQDAERAIVHHLVFDWPFAAGGAPKFTLRPVQVRPTSERALAALVKAEEARARGADKPKAAQAKISLSEHLYMMCTVHEVRHAHPPTAGGDKEWQCVPKWRRPQRAVRLARDLRPLSAQAQTGQRGRAVAQGDTPSEAPEPVEIATFFQYTPQSGLVLSQQARDLGLVEVLGSKTWQSNKIIAYLSSLAAGSRAEDFAITIDPDKQRLVKGIMDARLQARKLRGATVLPERWDSARRAAFILVDLAAEEGAGAVRVAYGHPARGQDMTQWDWAAYEAAGSGQNPMKAVVYEGVNTKWTPGSVMKLFTSYALIRAALGEDDLVLPEQSEAIGDALRGMAPEAYLETIKVYGEEGLNLKSAALKPKVAGWGREVINDHDKVAPHSKTVAGCRDPYGLCRALATSSNIWFGGMTLFLERDVIPTLKGKKQPQVLALGRALQSLGLSRRFALVRANAADQTADTMAPRGDQVVIEIQPRLAQDQAISAVQLQAELPKDKQRAISVDRFVASAGFGQNLQASPLAMAAITASLATSRRITPYLLYDHTKTPAVPDPLFKGDAERYMRELRKGMAAVVNARAGTAYKYFAGHASKDRKALARRVFAKTGTAQLGERKAYGSWFVGWVSMRGHPTTPRYAFVCAVTHLSPSGGLCADITAEILLALDAPPVGGR